MQDKWLSRIPRKGFMVTPISVRDIIDMYEYRKVLECFAAEKVAATATPGQIEELRSIVTPETAPRANLAQYLKHFYLLPVVSLRKRIVRTSNSEPVSLLKILRKR